MMQNVDYARLEQRIIAILSDSTVRDIHSETAAEIFGRKLNEVTPAERRAAKAINFAIMYSNTKGALP